MSPQDVRRHPLPCWIKQRSTQNGPQNAPKYAIRDPKNTKKSPEGSPCPSPDSFLDGEGIPPPHNPSRVLLAPLYYRANTNRIRRDRPNYNYVLQLLISYSVYLPNMICTWQRYCNNNQQFTFWATLYTRHCVLLIGLHCTRTMADPFLSLPQLCRLPL